MVVGNGIWTSQKEKKEDCGNEPTTYKTYRPTKPTEPLPQNSTKPELGVWWFWWFVGKETWTSYRRKQYQQTRKTYRTSDSREKELFPCFAAVEWSLASAAPELPMAMRFPTACSRWTDFSNYPATVNFPLSRNTFPSNWLEWMQKALANDLLLR